MAAAFLLILTTPAPARAQLVAEYERALARSQRISVEKDRIRDIEARLRQPIRVDFNNTPFPEALDHISERTGVAWAFRPRTVTALMIEPDTPVSLPPGTMPAGVALRLIANQLEFVVALPRPGFVEITDGEAVVARQETAVHFAIDLMIDAVGPARFDEMEFIDFLNESEYLGDGWECDRLPTRQLAWSVSGISVAYDRFGQERLEQAFAGLRVAAERARRLHHGPGIAAPGESRPIIVDPKAKQKWERMGESDYVLAARVTTKRPAREAAQTPPPDDRLSRAITLPAGPITTGKLLRLIGEQVGLRPDVDPAVGLPHDRELSLQMVRGRPGPDARWFIREVLEPLVELELETEVLGDRLRIGLERESRPVGRQYQILDLLSPPGRGDLRWTRFDEFVRMMHPESWVEDAGHRIHVAPHAGTMHVVQTEGCQMMLGEFLETMHRGRQRAEGHLAAHGIPPFIGWLLTPSGPPAPVVVRPPLPVSNADLAELAAPIPDTIEGVIWPGIIRRLSEMKRVPEVRTNRELLDSFTELTGVGWRPGNRPRFSFDEEKWLNEPLPEKPTSPAEYCRAIRETIKPIPTVDGRIMIGGDDEERFFSLIHPVADLVAREADPRQTLEQLKQRFEAEIDPDSWDVNGSNARIMIHAAIHEFLNRLRRR
jgi:hypothetical protein